MTRGIPVSGLDTYQVTYDKGCRVGILNRDDADNLLCDHVLAKVVTVLEISENGDWRDVGEAVNGGALLEIFYHVYEELSDNEWLEEGAWNRELENGSPTPHKKRKTRSKGHQSVY